MRKMLYIAGLLIALLLAGCQGAPASPTTDQLHGPALPTGFQTATPVAALPRPSVVADVPRITAQELRQLQQADPTLIIVDTRSLDAYNESHIQGAISIPLAEIPTRYRELPKDRPLALY
ncbi:MAG: rhodanese-like domain-containing protein [Chloroflexi bacterium]|nr:rhodanese-like domain-containing protein [Chloroflexota bacterium]